MTDPRVEAYARLLVERSVDVQPGWQVLVASTPLARPLVEEVLRQIARRGAHAITRIRFVPAGAITELAWLEEAPLELARELPPLERAVLEGIDAVIAVGADEDPNALAGVDRERLKAADQAIEPFQRRMAGREIPWVLCQYPTEAYARRAGMSPEEFTDFVFGACLIDWDAVGASMDAVADRLRAAREIRIVAEGTDLRLSIDGRPARVEDGRTNMPSGEVEICPVEDSAEGVIDFDRPNLVSGRDVTGVRLRFKGGRVVEATAREGEDSLLQALETDEGARRVGELGIGCNPGITRYVGNILFDEKVGGTVHLALGQGFPDIGGRNESAIHWDLVTDLRRGGRIELDGEVVQQDGVWRL